MGGDMNIRWPETILTDPEASAWIESRMFPEEWLDPSTFESTVELYRCTFPTYLLEFVVFGEPRPAAFTQEQLNRALVSASGASGFELAALWWNVNVHDNLARVVERVGVYSFDDPLVPLLIQLAFNTAEEGGTSYAGLLDRQRRWALSLEYGNDFVIAVHGPAAFSQHVAGQLAVGESP